MMTIAFTCIKKDKIPKVVPNSKSQQLECFIYYHVACDRGYFFNIGAGECRACPIGTYTETGSAISCSRCPSGLTTVHSGTSSSSMCYRGKYHPTSNRFQLHVIQRVVPSTSFTFMYHKGKYHPTSNHY